MRFISGIILALTALAAAKQASNQRTYAVNYFYGNGPLTEGRLDAIISPGQIPSNHVHTFMGGNALASTMGADTALAATCTTSKPKADKSNYWWPKLYFQDPNNGSFIDVDMYYAKVYYFSEPSDDETVAIPPGTQLLAGNAMRRSLNDQGGALNIDSGKGTINPVQFVCGGSNPAPWANSDGMHGIGLADPGTGGHGVGFPDANCDGYTTPLRYDLHFPSCINPNAPINNAFTNSVYPSSKGAKNGQNCPAGWLHVPHIFIEVYWNTPPFASLWTPGKGKQPFRLAQGDPTGYGLHGDFVSGWDTTEMQALIDGCDAGDAGFDQCADINAQGGVNPSSNECHIPAPFTEVITGVLDKLPGCNPLQWGPGDATVQTTNCGGTLTNTNTTTPSSSSSAIIAPVSTVASSSASASPVASSNSSSPSVGASSVRGASSSSAISSASSSTSSTVAVGGASSSSAPSSLSSTSSLFAVGGSSSTSTTVAPASSPTSSSSAEAASSSPVAASSSPSTSAATKATSLPETSACSPKKVTKTVVHKTTVTVTAAPQAELRRRRAHAHANPHRHGLRQEDSL